MRGSGRRVVIVDGVRTPFVKSGTRFENVPAQELGRAALRELLDRTGVDPGALDEVILGNIAGPADATNIARVVALKAGVPATVPAYTVNRNCASGMQSLVDAALRIEAGRADLVAAGGTESMSMVPMMGNKIALNQAVFANNEHVGIAYGMGITAENVAKQWKVTREEQDTFAAASHAKAGAAIAAGKFKDEILPYEIDASVPDLASGAIKHKKKLAENDEGPRLDTTIDTLAKLRTVFAAKGSVTAGNSSQMSDGAGAVILMSEKALKKYNVQPLARFVSFAVAGVPPEIMGIGPIKAIPKVLAQAGIKQDDLDWIELNEAFAAQALAVTKDLGLNPAKINPQGGAIALGHPLGATGALRVATLVHGMRREKQKWGMVTMCIGTGMGAAGLFEAL